MWLEVPLTNVAQLGVLTLPGVGNREGETVALTLNVEKRALCGEPFVETAKVTVTVCAQNESEALRYADSWIAMGDQRWRTSAFPIHRHWNQEEEAR